MSNKGELIFVLFIVMALCPVRSMAGDYNVRAAKVRAGVWAWDIPEFKHYTVPEKYIDESAVILARRRYIKASGEKGSLAHAFFFGQRGNRVSYTDIDRYMVKINDQAALEYYAEFSFQEMVKKSFYGNADRVETVVGVRIIKPDGTIKEIDVPAYAVSVTEGRKDKEAYKKLAIPELQTGDILDMFVYELSVFETINIDPQIIAFYTLEYPCLFSSVYCEFKGDITVEYRSINGAPDIKGKKDENGHVVLDAEMRDLLCVKGVETLRWSSLYRDLPMVRLLVLQNASPVIFKPASARQSGVHKNIAYETILKDAKGYFAKKRAYTPVSGEFTKHVDAAIQNYKKRSPAPANKELASYIYSVLNFYWPEKGYSTKPFMLTLGRYFWEHNIEFKYGFSTSRYGARRNEVVCHDDLFYVIMANDNTQLFAPSYQYLVTGDIPGVLEGETVSTFSVKAFRPSAIAPKLELEEVAGEYTVPVTAAGQNRNSSKLNVSFSQDDPLSLTIDRHMIWKGSDKEMIQDLMIAYVKWDSVMRRSLSIDRTFIEELAENKRERKQIGEVLAAFEKQREGYMDRMKGEIYTYHMTLPEQVVQYSIESFGISVESPDLEYNVMYTMNGLVKKAGDNLILDAGKLFGIQWNPSESERKRVIDAYLPTARMSDSEITIRIPEGYQVEGAGTLNYHFANEYGLFESVATVDGNTLTIKVKKVYTKAYIPLKDWDKLLEMVDCANRYYAQSVVLKKIFTRQD